MAILPQSGGAIGKGAATAWQCFDEASRSAILLAQQEAVGLGSGYVGAEHFLLSLAQQRDGIVAPILQHALQDSGMSVEKMRAAIAAETKPRGDISEPRLTPEAKRVLKLAVHETWPLRHDIGLAYLLLGLLRAKAPAFLEKLFAHAWRKIVLLPESSEQNALRPEGDVTTRLLHALGLNLKSVRSQAMVLSRATSVRPQRHGGYERLTEQAHRVVIAGQKEARMMGSGRIGAGHLLLGLLNEKETIAAHVLNEMGVPEEKARAEVRAKIESDCEAIGIAPKLTPEARRIFKAAAQEAHRMRYNYIGPEHLLLALLREKSGLVAEALRQFGVSEKELRMRIMEHLQIADDPGASLKKKKWKDA